MFRTIILPIFRSTSLCVTAYGMWFVPKVSVLIFYLNVYWTHLKLQLSPSEYDLWEVTQLFQRFLH